MAREVVADDPHIDAFHDELTGELVSPLTSCHAIDPAEAAAIVSALRIVRRPESLTCDCRSDPVVPVLVELLLRVDRHWPRKREVPESDGKMSILDCHSRGGIDMNNAL
jgi:hypothetical protein